MVTWSEDESEDDKEVENNEHVAFITLSENTTGGPQIRDVHGVVSKAIQTTARTHSLTLNQISHDDQTSDEDEEEISNEELTMSYKLLYDTWMDAVKDNKSFQGLVSQLSKEKNIK